ncbi:hypothetical protein PENSPDRAFT_755947 [Peniophora sp. CONT]|nr:hypothetical protein PENSPDRAFT_755947 [Peniophora sp. CONT]
MDSYFDFERYERSETTGRRGILNMTTEAEANDTMGIGMGTQFAEADSASIDQMYLPAYTVEFENGQWIVTHADGTRYITDVSPLPPLSPSLLAIVSSALSPPDLNLTPSAFPAIPEDAGAQDGPATTNDNFMTSDMNALSFPDISFQPGGQAAPAYRRNNNHSSGDVRHAPYPNSKPQDVAPGADLSANNDTSTGATLMGGALASDAGGVASSHTSAVQVPIPSPLNYVKGDKRNEWKRVCRYVGCVPVKPTKEGSWRGMPLFKYPWLLTRHVDSVHLGKTVKCPDCGDETSRDDSDHRHRLTCPGKGKGKGTKSGKGKGSVKGKGKGKGKGKAPSASTSILRKHNDHDGSGFGGGSPMGMAQYASAQAGPSRLPF